MRVVRAVSVDSLVRSITGRQLSADESIQQRALKILKEERLSTTDLIKKLGKSKGKEFASAVFYYELDAVLRSNESISKKGTVSLIK